MGVSPIEMSQMFTRTQDISPIKQHEDVKPMLDQNAFQQQLEKQVEERSRKVFDPEKSTKNEYDYDARKKGNGEYSGNSGKRKKSGQDKDKKDEEEKAFGSHSFDIRI